MLTEAIVVAILSLVGTLAGTFGGILTSNRLTGYRIEQLEKQVEKHNSVIERVQILEDRNAFQDEKLNKIIAFIDEYKRKGA